MSSRAGVVGDRRGRVSRASGRLSDIYSPRTRKSWQTVGRTHPFLGVCLSLLISASKARDVLAGMRLEEERVGIKQLHDNSENKKKRKHRVPKSTGEGDHATTNATTPSPVREVCATGADG